MQYVARTRSERVSVLESLMEEQANISNLLLGQSVGQERSVNWKMVPRTGARANTWRRVVLVLAEVREDYSSGLELRADLGTWEAAQAV